MPEKQKTYQLKLPSQSDNLALIRDMVSKIATQVGFDNDESSKIELAVDEACTNVIRHAYPQSPGQVIDVLIKVDANKLMITVSDKGKGFNPDTVKVSDLAESIRAGRRGGLGLRLIKTLMDKVDFQIQPGTKNQVKMVKYFS